MKGGLRHRTPRGRPDRPLPGPASPAGPLPAVTKTASARAVRLPLDDFSEIRARRVQSLVCSDRSGKREPRRVKVGRNDARALELREDDVHSSHRARENEHRLAGFDVCLTNTVQATRQGLDQAGHFKTHTLRQPHGLGGRHDGELREAAADSDEAARTDLDSPICTHMWSCPLANRGSAHRRTQSSTTRSPGSRSERGSFTISTMPATSCPPIAGYVGHRPPKICRSTVQIAAALQRTSTSPFSGDRPQLPAKTPAGDR